MIRPPNTNAPAAHYLSEYHCFHPNHLLTFSRSCSVACSRAHKENHPPDAPPPEKPAEVVPARPAPRHHFDVLLEHRAEIDRLFKKYPGLDRKLLELAGATDPPKTDGKDSFTLAMEQQARTVITGKKEQPWTEEIGMQRGLDALRESRTDCTNVADGLREYCELVTHLLSKEQRADPIEAVREKYVTQEARTIDRLRQEETANDD